MAKLIQDSKKIGYIPTVIDNSADNHPVFRRSDRDFQAFPEIVCYHVDRVLGIYRKPVILSRVLTNKILYAHFAWFPNWDIGRIYRSITYKLRYYSPEYNIFVSLQPWMDGLANKPPSNSVRDFLLLDARIIPQQQYQLRKELITVSNTLVFDFLVDEHDRKAEKNWVVSSNGTQLLWDNGLAFDHGPYGRYSCLDILCGHNTWRAGKQAKCDRICRFSVDMYQKLLELSKSSYTLGERVRDHLQSDLLFPLFQFARYEHYKDDKYPVSFKIENFWQGLDQRVETLLEHIGRCISLHGSDVVFM